MRAVTGVAWGPRPWTRKSVTRCDVHLLHAGRHATTVRTPLNSTDVLLRVSAMHEFLAAKLTSYASTCQLPPFPSNKSLVVVQWYKEASAPAMLLWCVYHSENANVDCGRDEVSNRELNSLSLQVVALKRVSRSLDESPALDFQPAFDKNFQSTSWKKIKAELTKKSLFFMKFGKHCAVLRSCGATK